MSRRLDISSLLCDEPPKDQRRQPDVVAEPVVLAPHLRNNARFETPQQQPPRLDALEALAHAATVEQNRLSSDHRIQQPPFNRAARIPDPRDLSPVEDHRRLRALPSVVPPLSLEELKQKQEQQHQHHVRLLQQHQQLALQQQQQQQQQLHARHHDQYHPHDNWDRRVPDAMGNPLDLRTGRKSDPGQLRTLPSPASPHSPLPPHLIPQQQQQMEPPSKRRRYSDAPPPVSDGYEWERALSLKLNGDRGILNPDAGRPDLLPAIRRPGSSSGILDTAQYRQRKALGVADSVLDRLGMGGPGGRIQSPPFHVGRRSPPGSQTGRAKAARKSDPDDPDPSLFSADRREYNTVIHLPERAREDYGLDSKRHKKSHSQGQPLPAPISRPLEYTPVPGPSRRPSEQDARPHGPPQRRPQPQQSQPQQPLRQPKEEDPHEWLLEHYADPSPDAQSRRKPDHPMSPSPLPAPSAPLPSAIPHMVKVKSLSPVPIRRATPPLVPATMPEAAMALEEELASVLVPKVEETKGDEMDVDVAVAELVEESGKGGVVGMEVDVEDELLSLVDDRPRSRSTHAPNMNRVPSGGSSKSAVRLQTDSGSRHASPMASAPSPSSFSARDSSMIPTSERGSMPPPASTVAGQGKASTPAAKKKKETVKPAPKPKVPAGPAAKPRAGPAPKPKGKASDGLTAAGPSAKSKAPSAISRKSASAAASASRSRSTSVMPGSSVGPESEKHEEDDADAVAAAVEDDKLYCVCKTKYDEDRFMIACDKCDEWYHTQCVDMPDLVVDLVDQFFCPLCIEKNPNLSLKTTYKPRCRYGLDHPEPDSAKACHKPAQGAFSKYCSPECGLNNIKKRIEVFAKNGGKKELLWDSVKDAQKREAVVIVHEEVVPPTATEGCTKENEDDASAAPVVTARVKPLNMGKVEREVANLNAVLDEVVQLREDLKEGMEIILWRERLLELASERAEEVGQCGWDQRLCYGEDEWAEFGAGVLDSYEDGAKEGSMQVDGPGDPEDWWCVESDKCERHAGWQSIRSKDVSKEKEKKEEALLKLTTREREIRKRIEDIVEPFNRSCIDPFTAAPLKSSKLVNGSGKSKSNGDSKKGKKRKNPS